MSKAGFYREWITFTQKYGYYEGGKWVEGYLPFVYAKANVQPWKSGLAVDVGSAVTFFKDYKVAYTKTEVKWEEVPAGGELEGNPLFFYQGKWYEALGVQNYNTQAKNPKHIKYLAFHQDGAGGITLPEPTPMAELVEAFERAVNELHQLTPIVLEVL